MGAPFQLATAPTVTVDLVLSPVAGGQVSQLGSAPLPPANTTWTCPGNIPPNTPTGQYTLKAQLGGTTIAETPLSIVSTLQPQIAIIDPTTNAPSLLAYPVQGGGAPLLLGGWGFPDGKVTISFNGTPVTTAPSKNEFFKVLLATPDNRWTVETVNVTATEGAPRPRC